MEKSRHDKIREKQNVCQKQIFGKCDFKISCDNWNNSILHLSLNTEIFFKENVTFICGNNYFFAIQR